MYTVFIDKFHLLKRKILKCKASYAKKTRTDFNNFERSIESNMLLLSDTILIMSRAT